MRRHLRKKSFERRTVDERAGRVVRVRDEHEARIVGNRGHHRIEIVTVLHSRHDDRARA
jgi:hypothetical protein